jgi:hypothetical protein
MAKKYPAHPCAKKKIYHATKNPPPPQNHMVHPLVLFKQVLISVFTKYYSKVILWKLH